MTILKARNGNVEIAYESFGSGTPLLMIQGAGTQMVMWPVDLCTLLAEHGFQVVRIDLRDNGLSTHLDDVDGSPPAYTLRDMTDDVIAVFDALDWPTGFVLGGSMGGVVAQATAIHHPARVRGLISISSNPSTSLALNRPRIGTSLRMLAVMRRRCANRDAEGQRWADVLRVAGGKDSPADEADWREAGRLCFDHGINPAGQMRQTAATWRAGDRRAALSELRMPSLVIHGSDDPMTSPRAGRATAAAIPGARFVLYQGMRHILTRPFWSAAVSDIAALAATAARPR